VGGQSEQPDGGDRTKAAFSDALMRAAVKFGVGRYLYRLPSQWCDYDPQTRRFVKEPALPAWALPGKRPAPLDAEGVRRLQQLADKKGVGLGKYLPQGVVLEALTADQARQVWKRISQLPGVPRAPPANSTAEAASYTPLAVARRSASVPF
jgi:hypothetical protein